MVITGIVWGDFPMACCVYKKHCTIHINSSNPTSRIVQHCWPSSQQQRAHHVHGSWSQQEAGSTQWLSPLILRSVGTKLWRGKYLLVFWYRKTQWVRLYAQKRCDIVYHYFNNFSYYCLWHITDPGLPSHLHWEFLVQWSVEHQVALYDQSLHSSTAWCGRRPKTQCKRV